MLFFVTLKRIKNFILLNISYLLTRLTGSIVLWGKPYCLSIESSGSCQLSCPECPLGNGKNKAREMLSFDLYRKIIEECKSHCMICSLYFQGEAFLNPNIFNFIKYARSAKIYTIISTNANFNNADWPEKIITSGLNELIISLDGLTDDTYKAYRKGGNLDTVTNNLIRLSKLVKENKNISIKISIQFLVMKHNEHEIPAVKQLAKNLNFKLSLKSIQIQDVLKDSHLLPNDTKYSRYKKTKTGYSLRNPLKNHCKRLYFNPVITSEGEVRPCCFDKAGKFPFGNIKTVSFKEIWNSEAYNNFRKKVFSDRKNIDICTNCTEGTKKIYV